MPVDGASGCLGSFLRRKQEHEYLKLVLSIGGGAASQNFATASSTAATRDNFGRSAKGEQHHWCRLCSWGNTAIGSSACGQFPDG